MKNQVILCAFTFVMLQACGEISCVGQKCDPAISYPQPGACPDMHVAPGDPGGPCKDGFSAGCNSDTFACIRGTCVPCGQPGQACCTKLNIGNDSQISCPGGGVCEPQPGSPSICNLNCGQPGLPCCAPGVNNICDHRLCDLETLTCSTQVSCDVSPGDPFFELKVIDPKSRCGGLFGIQAYSLEQAAACSSSAFTAKGLEMVPDDWVLSSFQVCNVPEEDINQPNSITVQAYSEDDAVHCGASQCSDCKTTLLGPCPPKKP